MSAINPYDNIRREVLQENPLAKTVFIDCDLDTLVGRDPKGLYKRALLTDGDPNKIHNFTGISDPYENPVDADLIINTSEEGVEESIRKLISFIFKHTHTED